MSKGNKKLRFISINPTKKDEFDQEVHNHIATKILDIIKSEEHFGLERQVIGLEGEWGSGKSSIIRILEEKNARNTDLKIEFFTYDVWNHQEDLTNRNFLEELFIYLNKKGIINEEETKEKIEKLFGKSLKTKLKKYPNLNFDFIFLILLLMILPYISAIFSYLVPSNFLKLGITYNWIKKIIYDDILKSTVIRTQMLNKIYYIIFFLFIIGIYIFVISNKSQKKTLKDKISELFSIFKGIETESTTENFVFEGETRANKFREELFEVNKKLKNKRLVIIFDNLDRIQPSKIIKMWATIHTFFAEIENKNQNIWVIIPYDKNIIENAFISEKILRNIKDEKNKENNSFISKTIANSFRISEPILSDWSNFFDKTIIKAIDGISEKDKNMIRLIFDRSEPNKTPRKIITFINEIISLMLVNINETIDLKYYALFVVIKDSLENREDIINCLNSDKALQKAKNMEIIFRDDENWLTFISAIYFNVPLNVADEVLMYENIKTSMLEGRTLETYSEHPNFKNVLNKIKVEIVVGETIDWENVLKSLKTLVSFQSYDLDILFNRMAKVNENSWKNEMKDFYFELLEYGLNVKIKENLEKIMIRKIKEKFIEGIRGSDFSRTNYVSYVKDIDMLRNYNTEMVNNIMENLDTISFSRIHELLKITIDYKKYGVILEEGVEEEIIDLIKEKDFDIEYLNSIDIVKGDINRETILKELDNMYPYYNNVNTIFSGIQVILKRILGDSSKNLKIRLDFYNIMLSNNNLNEEVVNEIMLVVLSKGQELSSISNFNGTNLSYLHSRYSTFLKNDKDLEKKATILAEYIKYEDLISKLLENKSELEVLNKLAKLLIENAVYLKLEVGYIIENYSKIRKIFEYHVDIYKEDFMKTYRKDLKRWYKFFESREDFLNCSELILDMLDDKDEYSKKVEIVVNNNFEEKNWESEIIKKTPKIELFFDLLDRKLISKKSEKKFVNNFEGIINNLEIKKIKEFMEEYSERLYTLIENRKAIKDRITNVIISKSDLDIEIIELFENFIFKNLSNKNLDDFVCNVLLKIFNDEKGILIVDKYEKLVKKIMKEYNGEYKKDICDLLNEKNEEGNSEQIKEFLECIKCEKIEKL